MMALYNQYITLQNLTRLSEHGINDGNKRMHPCWNITLFGELSARQGTERVAQFDTRQTAGLLAYLAFYRQRSHSRDMLAERLWPEEDSTATRSRLRTALWALRRILEPEETPRGSVLIADRTEIRLMAEAIVTDVDTFERAVRAAAKAGDAAERADCLCRAAELYGGELLRDWYDEWVLAERNRLAEVYRTTLYRAVEALTEIGNTAEAIRLARLAVAADTLREEAHAALIRLYVQAGQPVDAVRQFQELERLLRVEMGMRLSPETRALLNQMPRPATISKSAAPIASQPVSPSPMNSLPGLQLEPEGGAVPLTSSFYIERETDSLFTTAVARQDSIVLVKGARQVGKTSLLARGLQQARQAGTRVVLTDFQKLTVRQLESSDSLFLTLARDIADQLELDIAVDELWLPAWGWNVNFERFLRREVLKPENPPVVWGLDEVDRLFGHPDSASVFGLFRSWHNARSLNPEGPWSRLTLAMAYATEAHLFITDLNQSPFNVGTRLTLNDFTPDEVAELNRRYNAPLQSEAEVARFMVLVGGQPYLVRRGLHAMIESDLDLAAFEVQAIQEDGLFSDHLRRMRLAVQQDAELYAALCAVLRGQPCPSGEAFFRLQSAGILAGHSLADAHLRCGLYQTYLATHLL
jgi:DNA-binding SARP family transcriptional activator